MNAMEGAVVLIHLFTIAYQYNKLWIRNGVRGTIRFIGNFVAHNSVLLDQVGYIGRFLGIARRIYSLQICIGETLCVNMYGFYAIQVASM